MPGNIKLSRYPEITATPRITASNGSRRLSSIMV